MRRYLVLFVLFTVSHNVTATPSTEGVIEARVNDFLEGASENDVSVHQRFWHPNLTYTSSNGRRFGKAELMAGIGSNEGPPSQVRYRAEDLDIRLLADDHALITFTLVAEGTTQSDKFYYNSGVLRLDKGEWRALNWHATKALELVAPAANRDD